MTTVATEVSAERPPKTSGRPPLSTRFRPRGLFALGLQIVVVVVFLVAWEVSSRNNWVDPLIAGSPTGTWAAFWEYLGSPEAWSSMRATGIAVLLAFLIGSTLGTAFGLALGLFPLLGTVLGPFMAPINSIPRIALAPLFIAWFGLTTTSKVVLGVSVVFFILAENARGAVRSVDQDILTLSKVMGIRGRALVWKIVLPSVVPTMFAGVRLSYTYALLGVVASEMIAAVNGIGQDIVRYSTSFQIDTVFAILLIIMIVTVAVNAVFSAAERRLLIWQEQ